MAWADQHEAANGDWPKQYSGQVSSGDETWAGINTALNRGKRGLPRGSSLGKLLAEHRGIRNHMQLRNLSVRQVLTLADAHQRRTRDWPNAKSGHVNGIDETWAGINAALGKGLRGLPSGTTLAKLLAEQRSVRNRKDLSRLTIKRILEWVDLYVKKTGKWPNVKSGPVNSTGETWAGINNALNRGRRGLPSGSSLAQLLAEHRGVRNIQELPPLTIMQILAWADAYKSARDEWPKRSSGLVADADETWAGIYSALNLGLRGLPGGSSLAKLLAEHRSVRRLE